MSTYRYALQKGGKKTNCAECGKRTFVPFLDTLTGELLPDEYGRCDREVNCTYFLDPYKSGYAKMISDKERGDNVSEWKPIKPFVPVKKTLLATSYIPVEIFKRSRDRYENNNFVEYLTTLFDSQTTADLISKYHIGTSAHEFTHKDYPEYKSEKGACIFWQIDLFGKVRSGKVMLYSPNTGKRLKEPFSHIHWAHSILRIKDYHLVQCLFGEHLLKIHPEKPVAVVESEKTAIIASVYLPTFNWVAIGSLSNLKAENCTSLKGKKVYLFPDLKAYDRWSIRALELRESLIGTTFIVSNFLESISSDEEKIQGLDLADYLVQHRCESFSCNTVLKKDKPSTISETAVVASTEATFEEQPEERAPIAETFDLLEHWQWFETLPHQHHPINLLTCDNEVFNARFFVNGRLNHINAFTGYREQGNKLLFIRQVQELRHIFNNQ